MHFGVGLAVGDVLVEPDGTLYGDGVNIAARMEALADAGGICLSSTAHDHVKGRVAAGFEDLGPQQVKNFAEPVRAFRVGPGRAEQPARPARAWRGADILTDRPSIAVLPFDNLSGDPEQDYFVDGLTEEIIGTLARIPDLAVIARNSTFQYKGQAADVREIGARLGVQYLVEGSVRRSGETIRVTAQLIKTADGVHLWTDSYERALSLDAIFAIQEEIAAAIASTLAGTFGVLRQDPLQTARRDRPNDLGSYECVLLAMEHMRSVSRESHAAARDCLERTVGKDSDYAAAWVWLAHTHLSGYRMDYDPRQAVVERALEAAHRAIELAPDDWRGYVALADAHFWNGDRQGFLAAAERAIALGPNDPLALALIGVWSAYVGQWDRGLALIKQAKVLTPFQPVWFHFPEYYDHYRKRDYESALEVAQSINPSQNIWAAACLAAAYGQLGRADLAAPVVADILARRPDFEASARASRWKFFRYQEDLLDQFMDGLRKAGLNVEVKGG